MTKFNKKSELIIRRALCALLIVGFQCTTYAQSVNCDQLKIEISEAKDRKINRIGDSKKYQAALNSSAMECLAALNALMNSTMPSGSIGGIGSISLSKIVGWMAKKACAVVLAEANKVTQIVINGVTKPIEGLITLANGGIRFYNGAVTDSSGRLLPAGTSFEYVDINGETMISTVQPIVDIYSSTNSAPLKPSTPRSQEGSLPSVVTDQPVKSSQTSSNSGSSIWDRVGCAFTGGANCN